ncbi:GlxA family transcriptional regulator [Thalassovita sp.]|uniref:GlxA family transcriptional regulator n=1 Tax=Thalassovita sp. TaxID=1979401 RepID=UPI003B599CC0
MHTFTKPAAIAPSKPKRVVMLTFEGASSLDTVGPVDVLAGAQMAFQTSAPIYEIEMVSLKGGLISTNPAGVTINTIALAELGEGSIDIFLIAGGENAIEVARDADMCAAIQMLSKRATRVASICTGAFLLAAAGLLNNRKATTHWNWSDQLAREYPEIEVDEDKIFVQDGHVFTSAGITAGMDLALALIESDFGSEIALSVAQLWVMFLKRPGGQSQFSSFLPPSEVATDPIAKVLIWAQDHLDTDLSVEAMADQCSMSPRNFARRFADKIGNTPSKYIEKLRVRAARSYLETTDMPMDLIASATGFQSADRMRRSFNRMLHVNPQEYRERFRLQN